MTELKDTIKLFLDKRNLTSTALAKRAGITDGAISKILSGKTVNPSIAVMCHLAEALGVSVDALISGDENIRPLIPSAGSRRVPLLSWVQAGVFTDVRQLPPDGIDWYLCPVSISSKGFCLTVEGESMQPKFQPGDIVFVDPERAYYSGSIVIVVDSPDTAEVTATMKQLITEDGHTYMRPLNPDWPGPKFIEFTASMRIVGVVIGKFVET